MKKAGVRNRRQPPDGRVRGEAQPNGKLAPIKPLELAGASF